MLASSHKDQKYQQLHLQADNMMNATMKAFFQNRSLKLKQ